MRYLLWTICLAVLLVVTELLSRPLLPIDETRYMSVAWEAHVSGDHLVSHLNTKTYAHKPPLLFWLINAVWYVTGMNEYAARLVSPTAGIVCLLLTAIMARKLWPDAISFQRCAPMMLLSMTVWIVFCPVTMFDMLLTCFTLLGLLGVLRAEAGAAKTGWLLAGIAMGLGVLSKGPVILVHVVPAALLAPWWSPRVRTSYLRWYGGCLLAIVIAAGIGLSWALPSAAAGGKAYSDELLFGQTAGRMVNSFAHREPFWWYLPVLPICLTPWISFGAAWRGMKSTNLDSPLKFLLSWAGASFLILSLVSGKQAYYMMPAIPAFALILARLATSVEGPVLKRDMAFAIAGTILLGAFPLIANHLPVLAETGLKNLIADWYSIPMMACGAVLIPFSWKRIESAVFAVGTTGILFFVLVILSVRPSLWTGFDLRPLSSTVASHEGDVGWYGSYHGQINYVGKIRHVFVPENVDELAEWLQSHPSAVFIVRLSKINAASLNAAGIESTIEGRLSDSQADTIHQIIRADASFPGHDWQPVATDLHWIRTGLPLVPFVVVRYEAPPKA
jgi:4-amino-4-deoxy-L-arabinose transferase-like glycosyltransferase